MKKNTNEPANIFVVIGLCAAIVFGIQMAFWIAVDYSFQNNPDRMGPFGDTFGAVNTFFSGVAMFAVVYTLLLQHRQLAQHEREIRETKNLTQIQIDQSVTPILELSLSIQNLNKEKCRQHLKIKNVGFPAYEVHGTYGGFKQVTEVPSIPTKDERTLAFEIPVEKRQSTGVLFYRNAVGTKYKIEFGYTTELFTHSIPERIEPVTG